MDEPHRSDELKKYIVIKSDLDLGDLEGGVNYYMNIGYRPSGNVSVVKVDGAYGWHFEYFQAMVRNG